MATSNEIAYEPLSMEESISTVSQGGHSSCKWVTDILAIDILNSLERDAQLCILCKILRMFSFGFLAVMLVIYLIGLNFDAKAVGLMFTLTLLGDAILSIVLTTHADVWGRKFTLLIGSSVAIGTSLVFIAATNYWILVVVAIVGIISPSGSEVGPFLAIEVSSLSQVSRDEDRTKVLAWYNLFGSCSSATGALTCGVIMHLLQNQAHWSLLNTCRVIMCIYTLVHICLMLAISQLSPRIEVTKSSGAAVTPVGQFLGLHKSKFLVLKLCSLFLLDSFGGSLILQSFISNWFRVTYGTSSATLGTIVFICNIAAGVSALFAAKLADQIGLIMTMFVTHLPSNVFTILLPLMPNETLAIVMICARYSISQMDVPTRNAYVQGVVEPDERSAANGVTNVVRSLGASTGPFLAGFLYANPKYQNYPFFIAGSLKILYDILLLYNMASVKPAHELAKGKSDKA